MQCSTCWLKTVAVGMLLIALAVPGRAAVGQGKSPAAPAKSGSVPPGKAKKVTAAHAVTVTREVLIARGFNVVRVEIVKGSHVIYYRRGNNGRGRGLGPVEMMVVRPAGDIVVFEKAPEQVRIDLRIRLGF